MTVWAVRTGRAGEHEERFLDHARAYATWDQLWTDLSQLQSQGAIRAELANAYPDQDNNRCLGNWSGQLWRFSNDMTAGDCLLVPSRQARAVHVAEIESSYEFDPDAEEPYFHSRALRWMRTHIPRADFDEDVQRTLRYTSKTIFRVGDEDTAALIRAMVADS